MMQIGIVLLFLDLAVLVVVFVYVNVSLLKLCVFSWLCVFVL